MVRPPLQSWGVACMFFWMSTYSLAPVYLTVTLREPLSGLPLPASKVSVGAGSAPDAGSARFLFPVSWYAFSAKPSTPDMNVASGPPTIAPSMPPPPPVPPPAVPPPPLVPALPPLPVEDWQGPFTHCEFISGSEPKQPSAPVSKQVSKQMRMKGLVMVSAFPRVTTTSTRTGPPCRRPPWRPTRKDRKGTRPSRG